LHESSGWNRCAARVAEFPQPVFALPVLTQDEAMLRVATLRTAPGNTTLPASSSDNAGNVGVMNR